jgi:hypothetical protein
MSTDYKFQGWMGLDKSADKGNMKWQEYEPKKWEETDVDIQVSQDRRLTNVAEADVAFIDHTLWYLRL